MDSELEYSKNFLQFLTKYKESGNICVAPDPNFKKDNIQKSGYYSLNIFRTYICELFYNAVNYFPYISEYIIECTNDKGVSTLSMGYYTDLDDENEMCLAKLKNKHYEICLNKLDVQQLYIANRTNHTDVNDTVNLVISSLYTSGYEPTVKTYYKSIASKTKPVKTTRMC